MSSGLFSKKKGVSLVNQNLNTAEKDQDQQNNDQNEEWIDENIQNLPQQGGQTVIEESIEEMEQGSKQPHTWQWGQQVQEEAPKPQVKSTQKYVPPTVSKTGKQSVKQNEMEFPEIGKQPNASKQQKSVWQNPSQPEQKNEKQGVQSNNVYEALQNEQEDQKSQEGEDKKQTKASKKQKKTQEVQLNVQISTTEYQKTQQQNNAFEILQNPEDKVQQRYRDSKFGQQRDYNKKKERGFVRKEDIGFVRNTELQTAEANQDFPNIKKGEKKTGFGFSSNQNQGWRTENVKNEEAPKNGWRQEKVESEKPLEEVKRKTFINSKKQQQKPSEPQEQKTEETPQETETQSQNQKVKAPQTQQAAQVAKAQPKVQSVWGSSQLTPQSFQAENSSNPQEKS